MLLWSILTAISIFYISVSKSFVGVGKGLEGLMMWFLWKGSEKGQSRGMPMI